MGDKLTFAASENIGIWVFNPRATRPSVVVRTCPICQVHVPDLQEHCDSMPDDEEHTALGVHDV